MFGLGFICLLFCEGGKYINDALNIYLYQSQIGRPGGEKPTFLQTELPSKDITKILLC